MVSIRLIVLVVLIMIQLHSTSAWVMLFNCTNCDTLHSLLNKPRTNFSLIQDNTLSKSIDHASDTFDSERLADPTAESSPYATEQISSTWITTTTAWEEDSVSSISTENSTANPTPNVTSTTISTSPISQSSITATTNLITSSGINSTITSPITQSSITGQETTATTNLITSGGIDTTTTPPKSEENLALILGLTLGLGIPICLAIIGSLVYYFKIYRPRHGRVVIITN